MAEEKAVYNETVGYVLAQLANIEVEIESSQSALLASGFLPFDAARIISELTAVISTISNEKPIDYPETHPHPVE